MEADHQPESCPNGYTRNEKRYPFLPVTTNGLWMDVMFPAFAFL